MKDEEGNFVKDTDKVSKMGEERDVCLSILG